MKNSLQALLQTLEERCRNQGAPLSKPKHHRKTNKRSGRPSSNQISTRRHRERLKLDWGTQRSSDWWIWREKWAGGDLMGMDRQEVEGERGGSGD